MYLILFQLRATEPPEPCRESYALNQFQKRRIRVYYPYPVLLAVRYCPRRVDRRVLVDSVKWYSGHLRQPQYAVAVLAAGVGQLYRTLVPRFRV